MSSYYYNIREHDHGLAHDLARQLSHETRHSAHPTQYIVNRGKMTMDDRSFRHSNAFIYNTPGSSLRIVPTQTESVTRTRYGSYHSPPQIST